MKRRQRRKPDIALNPWPPLTRCDGDVLFDCLSRTPPKPVYTVEPKTRHVVEDGLGEMARIRKRSDDET